uniref:hypothetical protein n=1 Tax=Nocardia terpenica TaxID=455432 RepID=UPI001E5F0708|nr:hypothetical protein [Nocardia terpenica]
MKSILGRFSGPPPRNPDPELEPEAAEPESGGAPWGEPGPDADPEPGPVAEPEPGDPELGPELEPGPGP